MNEEQEEFNTIMDGLEQEIRKEQDDNVKRDQFVLDSLKHELSTPWMDDIQEYLSECEACSGSLKIVNSHPSFESQPEGEYIFKKAWVDQHVGIMGDDYHGNIWIPLPNKKYLKFYYSM